MSCHQDAAHCNQIAGQHGAPETVAVWSAVAQGETGLSAIRGALEDSSAVVRETAHKAMTKIKGPNYAKI